MSGLIPPHLLEQVRAASDIVDVIGSYLPLKRAGANFVALCPFHREKTPSFHVNPQRQIFHCFGCHKGGDVFAFVKEHENLSFVEAVQRLADRAHIVLEFENDPARRQLRSHKDALLEMHEQITQRWQAVLTNDAAGQAARDYLARRQIPDEAVRRFRLGFAPEAWDDTVNWARSKGYELPLVEEAGLVVRKPAEGGGADRWYDRFRGRLMFPICDEQGRVVAFSGRILATDVQAAKYVNSPETPLFTKGRLLFGLDKSKRAILDAGAVVICEGQLDLIACFMAGIENVVAPQGTALTGAHCRILKRYVDEVVLCFDSDNAGQNAAMRSLDDLLSSGLAIRVATVPAPHDPDSYIKAHGGEAFRKVLQAAVGFFDYLLNRLAQTNDLQSDRGRQALVRGMAESLLKSGDAVLIDTYAQKTAQRLGVSVAAVNAEFRKARATASARTVAEPSGVAEPAPTRVLPTPEEALLLRLLLQEDALADWLEAHLDPDWLPTSEVRQVVARRLAAGNEGHWNGVAPLLAELPQPALQQLVTEAVADRRGLVDPPRQLQDAVRRLRDAFFDRQIAEVNRRLADPALAHEEAKRLTAVKVGLVTAKRQPLAPRAEG